MMISKPTGNAVLFSYHHVASKRRAGFHAVAESLVRAGWEVTFVTGPLSRISSLRRDHRLRYETPLNRLVQINDCLQHYIHYTTVHPVRWRSESMNALSASFVDHYAKSRLGDLEPSIVRADLMIFESTPAVLLIPSLRRLNRSCPVVYRVSDDLRRVGAHPGVLAREQELLDGFASITVPSRKLYEERYESQPNARWLSHGVHKELFALAGDSPYGPRSVNACFVGVQAADKRFLQVAAAARPEVTFHVIGHPPTRGLPPNVRFYGELPYADTLPYVKFADVGMCLHEPHPYAHTIASLKVLQFLFCGVPVVLPTFLETEMHGTFSYVPGESASILGALDQALASGPVVDEPAIPSWDEVTQSMLALAGIGRR